MVALKPPRHQAPGERQRIWSAGSPFHDNQSMAACGCYGGNTRGLARNAAPCLTWNQRGICSIAGSRSRGHAIDRRVLWCGDSLIGCRQRIYDVAAVNSPAYDGCCRATCYNGGGGTSGRRRGGGRANRGGDCSAIDDHAICGARRRLVDVDGPGGSTRIALIGCDTARDGHRSIDAGIALRVLKQGLVLAWRIGRWRRATGRNNLGAIRYALSPCSGRRSHQNPGYNDVGKPLHPDAIPWALRCINTT